MLASAAAARLCCAVTAEAKTSRTLSESARSSACASGASTPSSAKSDVSEAVVEALSASSSDDISVMSCRRNTAGSTQ